MIVTVPISFPYPFQSEVKLSELSEVVGNYEKLRLQDQQAIQKLKERLQQLDVENASLSRQLSFDDNLSPNNEKENEEESPEDLKKHLNKLRGLLRIALDSADMPLKLGENNIIQFVCFCQCRVLLLYPVASTTMIED